MIMSPLEYELKEKWNEDIFHRLKRKELDKLERVDDIPKVFEKIPCYFRS